MVKPAIFVDRDGTLIEEVNFLCRIDQLRLFPFTAKAVKLFKTHGYLIIVVTNQSGIEREVFSEAEMQAIHDEIQARLGGEIDAFYFCPHRPDAGCICRKPALGMIQSACRDFDIDLAASWMVGDKAIDVITGQNAAIRSAMVMTGYGREQIESLSLPPDIVAADLLAAASAITGQQP